VHTERYRDQKAISTAHFKMGRVPVRLRQVSNRILYPIWEPAIRKNTDVEALAVFLDNSVYIVRLILSIKNKSLSLSKIVCVCVCSDHHEAVQSHDRRLIRNIGLKNAPENVWMHYQ